jgi:hypothetical protein
MISTANFEIWNGRGKIKYNFYRRFWQLHWTNKHLKSTPISKMLTAPLDSAYIGAPHKEFLCVCFGAFHSSPHYFIERRTNTRCALCQHHSRDVWDFNSNNKQKSNLNTDWAHASGYSPGWESEYKLLAAA